MSYLLFLRISLLLADICRVSRKHCLPRRNLVPKPAKAVQTDAFLDFRTAKKNQVSPPLFPLPTFLYHPAFKSSALLNEGADRLKRELSISTLYERKEKKKNQTHLTPFELSANHTRQNISLPPLKNYDYVNMVLTVRSQVKHLYEPSILEMK